MFFSSYHPYLFFNEDGNTITFVGFNANRNGDLVDPVKGVIIENRAIDSQLFAGLQRNGVDLHEKYNMWTKNTMMEKMCQVMGLEFNEDPDPSYVLTPDNLIKIIALKMRFR